MAGCLLPQSPGSSLTDGEVGEGHSGPRQWLESLWCVQRIMEAYSPVRRGETISVVLIPAFPEEAEFNTRIQQNKTPRDWNSQNGNVLSRDLIFVGSPYIDFVRHATRPEQVIWPPSLDHFLCARCSWKHYRLYQI